MERLTRLRAWLLAQMEGDGLKAATIRGSIWTGGGFAASQLLRIGSNLILTRLLAPEAFGLMALVSMAMTGLQLFSDFGVRDALIRNQRAEEPEFYSTAWTIQVIRGMVLAVAAVAIAGPVSLAYEQPELSGMLKVMAIALTVDGFVSIGTHLEMRAMRMRGVVIYRLAAQIMTLTATALLAYWLRSVWALVVGAVLGNVIGVALSYLLLPRYPQRLMLDYGAAAEILRFGKWIFVATILTFAGQGGATALQGLLVPLDTLAFISIAGNLSLVLAGVVMHLTSSVGFSAIAQAMRDSRERGVRGVRKIGTVVAVVSTAGALALALIARPVIDLIYDPRYADVGLYLQFMALGVGMANLSLIYGSALLALGESRTYAAFRGVDAAARLSLTYLGFRVGGPVGLTVGLGAGSVVTLAVALAIAARGGYANLKIDLAAAAALIAACGVALAAM